VRARFRAQSRVLFVVLLDVRLLVPGLQTVVFLLGALHAAAGTAGLEASLEKSGNDVGLTDSASGIE
jgi:hypothetical protein